MGEANMHVLVVESCAIMACDALSIEAKANKRDS